MKEIKKSCRDCVFAKRQSGKQVGCDLKRTKLFEKQGKLQLLGDNGEFHTLSRFCSTYRIDDWAKGKNISLLKTIVRAEVTNVFEVIIRIGNKDLFQIDEFERIVHQLSQQILQPKITIATSISREDNSGAIQQCLRLLKKSNLYFNITNFTAEDTEDKIKDKILAKSKSTFFQYIKWPDIKKNNFADDEFFANIDEAINDKLIQFSIVKIRDDFTNAIVSTHTYNALYGNDDVDLEYDQEYPDKARHYETDFFAKIKYLTKKENNDFLIRDYKDLL
jgi:hypothetical protein